MKRLFFAITLVSVLLISMLSQASLVPVGGILSATATADEPLFYGEYWGETRITEHSELTWGGTRYGTFMTEASIDAVAAPDIIGGSQVSYIDSSLQANRISGSISLTTKWGDGSILATEMYALGDAAGQVIFDLTERSPVVLSASKAQSDMGNWGYTTLTLWEGANKIVDIRDTGSWTGDVNPDSNSLSLSTPSLEPGRYTIEWGLNDKSGCTHGTSHGPYRDVQFSLSVVPIPPTLLLMGSGLLGLIAISRRRIMK